MLAASTTVQQRVEQTRQQLKDYHISNLVLQVAWITLQVLILTFQYDILRVGGSHQNAVVRRESVGDPLIEIVGHDIVY